MGMTPLDIQQQQFRVRFRGFDVQEVDMFLETAAENVEAMEAENERLLENIDRLENELQGFREREEAFKRAMLQAQKVQEQIKENARKAAELTMAEAEVKAEKILNRAHSRLAQIHEDIAELKRQRMQIEVQIRAVLESHSKLLEMGKAEAKAMDEVDSKLKLLKQSSP